MHLRRLFALAALLVACGHAHAQSSQLAVLMIGNSYTQGSSGSVASFGAADPAIQLTFDEAAVGGQTLQWHFQNRWERVYDGGTTNLRGKLGSQPWDHVILQDYSTRAANAFLGVAVDRSGFQTGVQGLAAFIGQFAPTAQLHLFETWARAPGSSYLLSSFANDPVAMQAATNSSYRWMAPQVGAQTIPIGDAWLGHYAAYPFVTLHSTDFSHANSNGNYLTGAVIWGHVTGSPVAASTYSGGLSATNAAWFRQLADFTNFG